MKELRLPEKLYTHPAEITCIPQVKCAKTSNTRSAESNDKIGRYALRIGTNMKPTICLIAICAALPSISPGSQPASQQPTPAAAHFDASVPRQRQIELSLSAAPPEISSKATVYILGAKGYEKVREGTNGFSCLVERAFVGTTQVAVAPMCFDAEGTRTLLLVDLRKEELRAKGTPEQEINSDIANGYKDGRFKAPSKPGFLYMMSKENYVYDAQSKESGAFPRHLMFYAPYMTPKDLGYDSVSPTMVPYLVNPGEPDAMLVVVPAP